MDAVKKLTAGDSTNLLAIGPAGSLWVATCHNDEDPTVTDNWTWTQLPPIPVT